MLLIAEQTNNSQETLELMQLKEEFPSGDSQVEEFHPDVATDFVKAQAPWRVQKKVTFRAPPGLEDQLNMWLPQDTVLKASEDMKFSADQDDETTDTGSGSDRDGESSEDESPIELSANASEFSFGKLSADAPVFDPTPKLSADAPAFEPTPLPVRTGLRSGAKLFVPKTMLTITAGLFVPSAVAPTTAEPAAPKAKTKLAVVTTKSELFVPSFPDLKASLEMKTKGKKRR